MISYLLLYNRSQSSEGGNPSGVFGGSMSSSLISDGVRYCEKLLSSDVINGVLIIDVRSLARPAGADAGLKNCSN